ncbi:MAG TPA: 2-octaprenyl-6-methoxyphenyl hydroxylase [Cellvibrio sp.]|nr:2-octaprenyl-6-methoxyphenyl hydroxylase [Cellvibrio sp.]
MAPLVEFDIAIIGGGMVGASLASLLAVSQPQLRIALIEAQPFAQADAIHFQPSFDARSTALSYGTAAILRELGLWELLQQHITPIAQVHVSDRGHLLGGVIDAKENNLAAVGYVVENAWLGKVLLNHVQAQKNIQCFASSTVTALTPQQDCALLNVKTPAQNLLIKTALAVIADGGDSPLRSSLGIATQVRAYGQTAIITNVEFSEPHQGVAYERFTADGPVALLPLGETSRAQQSALVWTLPAAQADEVIALNDADFLDHLQTRFGFRVGRFTRVAKRFAYPLQLVLAEEQIRSHLVLVGNAAHFLHPVAGQGFNLALRDCACLVETLRVAIAARKSPGDLAVLQNYLDKQQLDQQVTIEFSDKLVRLFSSDHLPFIAMRHLGLLSLESIPLIKNQFIAQTMGTAGRQFRWLENPMEDQKAASKTAGKPVRDGEQNKNSDYDLIIVGAGVVGASLACAVAQTPAASDLRIAVIEANVSAVHFSGEHFDPRVVALTHASEQLLSDIGCWDEIVAQRVCAYREMKVWDGEGTAAIEFDCAEVQQSHLGHIVENSVLVNQLRARMAEHRNIDVIHSVAVAQVIPAQSEFPRVRVQLTDHKEISAPLLIAADGAQSKVRQLADFSTREWDYGQQAIITTVRTERPHEHTAWQRFMRTGPLAFLPLQHYDDAHHCSIVWSADDELATQLMALDDRAFCARLGEAFEFRLGDILACDKRFAIPLRQRHATTYIQPGIALVGDAAHNIHPLAGQGVNLGLLDVIALAREIERALERRIPLADYSILRRYQRQRLAANLGMMSAMEGFKRLFGSNSLSVNWLRNTGMRKLNSVPAIKKIIINTALGVS